MSSAEALSRRGLRLRSSLIRREYYRRSLILDFGGCFEEGNGALEHGMRKVGAR
jgi:hypothetical protein